MIRYSTRFGFERATLEFHLFAKRAPASRYKALVSTGFEERLTALQANVCGLGMGKLPSGMLSNVPATSPAALTKEALLTIFSKLAEVLARSSLCSDSNCDLGS